MTWYRYGVFGLVLRSSRAFPSLQLNRLPDDPVDTDVVVAAGPVEMSADPVRAMPGVLVGMREAEALLRVAEVGDFAVQDGRSIVYAADPGVVDREVDIYLLGTVFAVLLYQRGLLPFHCTALGIDGRAFLICGVSGAGKSTFAAFMEGRGHAILTDDMSPLSLKQSVPVALPGIPRLKLWSDAVAFLGRDDVPRTALPWHEDKWESALMQSARAGLPVQAIYHLRECAEGGDFALVRSHALEAANAVSSNIYRRRVADMLGLSRFHLAATRQVVAATPIFSVFRRWGHEHFVEEAVRIERHMHDQLRDPDAGG